MQRYNAYYYRRPQPRAALWQVIGLVVIFMLFMATIMTAPLLLALALAP